MQRSGKNGFYACSLVSENIDVEKDLNRRKLLLHFGAVDYECSVWLNGEPVGEHRGGYSSFSFDITEYVREGENNLVVLARDELRCGLQPRGKQSPTYFSGGCNYTRTTGIWQTVWLEEVPGKLYPLSAILSQCGGEQFDRQSKGAGNGAAGSPGVL